MINIVAIEGLDCSGKSTFTEALTEVLQTVGKNVHVEYVHFPDYSLESGKQIREILFHGDITKTRSRDKLMRLFIKNRHEWYVANYERLSQYDNVVILADRYRHSNDYLNASKFRDVPKAMAKYADIELNGYRVPKEVLNFLMDTPLDLIKQRVADKAKSVGIDQYETEANIEKVFSKKNLVTRHCMDKNFFILPGHMLDQHYMESKGNELYQSNDKMADYAMLYFSYMIAKQINIVLDNQGPRDKRGHFYIGRILKEPKIKIMTKVEMAKLRNAVVNG